jgi:hypothetical protein
VGDPPKVGLRRRAFFSSPLRLKDLGQEPGEIPPEIGKAVDPVEEGMPFAFLPADLERRIDLGDG